MGSTPLEAGKGVMQSGGGFTELKKSEDKKVLIP